MTILLLLLLLSCGDAPHTPEKPVTQIPDSGEVIAEQRERVQKMTNDADCILAYLKAGEEGKVPKACEPALPN